MTHEICKWHLLLYDRVICSGVPETFLLDKKNKAAGIACLTAVLKISWYQESQIMQSEITQDKGKAILILLSPQYDLAHNWQSHQIMYFLIVILAYRTVVYIPL